MDWKRIAQQKSNLVLARMQQCIGTGEATTILITGLIKLLSNDSEIRLLERFKRLLGSNYYLIFPDFRLLGEAEGHLVLELEYLGDHNLEGLLLSNNQQPMMQPVVDQVALLISKLADIRPVPKYNEKHRHQFLEEMRSGLCQNISLGEGVPVSMLESMIFEQAEFIPTLCHRDLSVMNVMYGPDDTIRFIDPRFVLPGSAHSTSAYGSIAIDCASFQVSLERKDLERERAGQTSLNLTCLFAQKISSMFISRGLFNEYMYHLCLAYTYSVYVACRCKYCVAPERKWLYDQMKEKFRNSLNRIL